VRWEAIVADAEVIPLGTRGRPGRGTGSRKPSAAARSLAGSAKPSKPAKGTSTGSAKPRRKSGPDTRSAEPPVEQPTTPGVPEQPAAGADGEADDHAAGSTAGRETSGTTATDRAPGAGIPVSDWLDAFGTASREVFGEQWEPRLAELLAFLRRRITGEYRVDEYGFDREVTERFFLAAFRPIAEKWFRVEARGVENIPTEGGALVVSNHSGTVPLDGLMTAVTLHDRTGRNLRPLGADLVFRLPVVGEMARKAGATLACNDDAERMLCGGELVGVWPEGFKGIGKPYSERYKLQRFGRGGFVSAAMRTGVPIVPCSVVGAEEIYPLVGNIPSLARLLGVPYIPITPFFPLLGPLGMIPLPSKWLIEFGEPIRTDSYDQGAADDPMLVFNVTDQVRETIQQTLYTLLMQRRSVFY
jgi:1-acyl-sn-glycerol-3-phosphate acyltransferase